MRLVPPPRLAAVGVLLLLAWLAPTSRLLAADSCWQFPDSASRREAERQYGLYWYELYPRAVQLLEDGKNLDAAIAQLRLAVSKESRSEKDKQNRVTKETMDYFPYYNLARAFAGQGHYEMAQECLDRESKNEIGGSSFARGFTSLDSDVKARVAVGGLVTQATSVLDWGRSPAGGWLNPEASRTNLAQIDDLRGQVQNPQSKDIGALSTRLAERMLDLCRGEMDRGRQVLQELNTETWRGAFTRSSTPDAAACSMPEGAASAGTAARAFSALKDCTANVEAAARAAGGWKCKSISDRLDTARSKSETATAWAGLEGVSPPAAVSLPALPGECGTKWQQAAPPEVVAAVSALGTSSKGLVENIGGQEGTIETWLAGRRQALASNLEAARKLIILPDSNCARDLRLGSSVVARLRQRSQDLDPARAFAQGLPPAELFAQPDQLVEDAMETLRSSVRNGVQQLRGEGAECGPAQSASFDALSGPSEGFLSSPGTTSLESLCRAARGAEAALNQCFGDPTVLYARVSSYASLLELAAASASDGCAAQSVRALRQVSRPGSSVSATWRGGARDSLRAAQDCLQTGWSASEETVQQIRSRLAQVASRLSRGGDGGGECDNTGSGLMKEVSAMQSRVPAEKDRLDKVAGLYEHSEGAAIERAGLESVLSETALRDKVGPAAWTLLDRFERESGADSPMMTAGLKVVRDSAVAPELAAIEETLAQWEPVARTFGPFLALNRAFCTFAKGNLDGAILSLREARSAGSFPDAGREAALGHAAMSYFLFTKRLTLTDRNDAGEVSRFLEDDAKREAKRAIQADSRLKELPRNLFSMNSFREFFAATTQGES